MVKLNGRDGSKFVADPKVARGALAKANDDAKLSRAANTIFFISSLQSACNGVPVTVEKLNFLPKT